MSEQRSECVIEGEVRPARPRPPAAAIVVVGFLLAAIVGMTSTTSPWLSGDGSHLSASAPAIVGQVLAVALAFGLCVLLALLWIQTPRRRKTRKESGGRTASADEVGSSLRASALVLIGGILVLAVLVAAFWFLLVQADTAPPPTSGATIGDADTLPAPEPAPSAPEAFDWFFLALIASIAVVTPFALVARRRLQKADPGRDADDAPESVVRAVGDSIDQIGRDPDARRAIIRAYAQMEHAFDDAGIPRRPYEAPFEYLGRALRILRVSPPAAGRLAALFERARFSQHELGAETKQEAIGALQDVQRQMQAPSP